MSKLKGIIAGSALALAAVQAAPAMAGDQVTFNVRYGNFSKYYGAFEFEGYRAATGIYGNGDIVTFTRPLTNGAYSGQAKVYIVVNGKSVACYYNLLVTKPDGKVKVAATVAATERGVKCGSRSTGSAGLSPSVQSFVYIEK